ncbi:spermatogenesis-associated protein 22-like isoform X2 [Haliotis rufescens]|uniref:spermatogenesis-associated protein 22-like isoform X2 n=1 Tax=Haliotis rufescens TaxID=6454 RepID=UPI00201E8FDA|nr:spermatogenesis-associated protein 22-like isoform X2 [Haliotis rufescens]
MQRGQHGGPSRPTPTPIFNHRKRQRQAMFADPSSNHSNTPSMPTAAQASYPGVTSDDIKLMPVGGFQAQGRRLQTPSTSAYGDSYSPAQKQRNCVSSGAGGAGGGRGSIAPSSVPTPSYHNNSNNNYSNSNYSNNNNITNNTVKVGWGHQGSQQAVPPKDQTNRTGRGGSSSFSRNTQQNSTNSQLQFQANQQPSRGNYSQQPSTRGNYNQQQNRNPNPVRGQNPQPGGGGVWNGGASNCNYDQSPHQYNHQAALASMGYSKGWGGVPPTPTALQAASPPHPGSLLTDSRGGVHTGFGQELACTSSRSKDVSKASSSKPSRLADTKGKNQAGLRVLSSSVAMVKRSALHTDQLGPHMLEVFGVLDSAVVTDKSGTGKEFVLRDETDTVHCIFYEIDRSLPRLIRGQWQRCVGSVEHKSGRLKCVSVRAAGAEEKHLAKLGEHHMEQQMTTGNRRPTEE